MSSRSTTGTTRSRCIVHIATVFSACCAITAVLLLSACGPRTPEGREAQHMQKGKAYLEAKEYKKAIIEFKVASQNMPKDVEPLYQLGMTYLARGNRPLALTTFQKAAQVDPNHEGTQYQMAVIKVGSGNPQTLEEARQTLVRHLSAQPGDTRAVGALAVALARLGNKEESTRLLYELAAKKPDDVGAATAVIGFYAAGGDVKTAVDLSRELSVRMPDSPEAATLRAEVSLATKDYADADAQIARALQLKPDFPAALRLRLRREITNRDPKDAEQTTRQIANLPDKRMWSAYAAMLFSEGKVDEAMTEFQRLLKEHDDDNDLRNQYSVLLRTAGRPKEAIAIVESTLAKDKKNRQALLLRASIENDAGDTTAASRDISTLLDMKAFSADLSYEQSRVMGSRGERVKQGDLLSEALKHNPRHFKARSDLTMLLVANGKARDALKLLEEAPPDEKRSAEYVLDRTRVLVAVGDWTEAEKSVEQALKGGRSPGVLYMDALVRTRKKDLAGARKSLEEALNMGADGPLTLRLLSAVMHEQGDDEKYEALIQQAAAKNPHSATLQTALGFRLAAHGDDKGARAAFEAAKSAGDANGEVELAVLDMRTGALDTAKQRLTELAKTHDTASLRVMLADIDSRRGAKDEAIRDYTKALQLEPSNIAAMNNLASFLACHTDKIDEAYFWAQKAAALAPDSPETSDTLGWVLYRQKKYEEALPYLKRSVRLHDRPAAHYHYAAVLARLGRPADGRQEYQVGLKEDPRSDARTAVAPLFETAQTK